MQSYLPKELSLANEIRFFRSTMKPEEPIDPHDPKQVSACYTKSYEFPKALPAKCGALVAIKEYVAIPTGFVGIATVRSTWARLGIISPPSTVHPGWEGYLTGEIFNHNSHAILLREDDVLWNLTVVPYRAYLREEPSRYTSNTPQIILPIVEG